MDRALNFVASWLERHGAALGAGLLRRILADSLGQGKCRAGSVALVVAVGAAWSMFSLHFLPRFRRANR